MNNIIRTIKHYRYLTQVPSVIDIEYRRLKNLSIGAGRAMTGKEFAILTDYATKLVLANVIIKEKVPAQKKPANNMMNKLLTREWV